MDNLPEFKKYIVFYSKRSDGPQCNGDHIRLVESPVFPTEDLLRENGMIYTGICTNVSYSGCEDCGGSRIVDFRVEDYSPERTKQLGLVEKLYGSDGYLDNYLHRLTPKTRLIPAGEHRTPDGIIIRVSKIEKVDI